MFIDIHELEVHPIDFREELRPDVIDLGPDAGDAGGRIVAMGPPESLALAPESRTGRYLDRRRIGAR